MLDAYMHWLFTDPNPHRSGDIEPYWGGIIILLMFGFFIVGGFCAAFQIESVKGVARIVTAYVIMLPLWPFVFVPLVGIVAVVCWGWLLFYICTPDKQNKREKISKLQDEIARLERECGIE